MASRTEEILRLAEAIEDHWAKIPPADVENAAIKLSHLVRRHIGDTRQHLEDEEAAKKYLQAKGILKGNNNGEV